MARRIGGGASVNGHDIRDIRFAGSGRPAGPLIENAVLRTRFSWQEVRVVANRPARAWLVTTSGNKTARIWVAGSSRSRCESTAVRFSLFPTRACRGVRPSG